MPRAPRKTAVAAQAAAAPPADETTPTDPTVPPHDPPAEPTGDDDTPDPDPSDDPDAPADALVGDGTGEPRGLHEALGAPDHVADPAPPAPPAEPAVREPGDHAGEYVGVGAEFVSFGDGTEWHVDPESGLVTEQA